MGRQLKFYAIFLLALASCASPPVPTLTSARPVANSDDGVDFATVISATEKYGKALGLRPEKRVPSAAATTWTEGRPGEIFPAVTDARVLTELEGLGFRFQDVLEQAKSPAATNADLAKRSALYRDFVGFSLSDIQASFTRENQYRPDWGPVSLSVTAKRKGFNGAWLSSSSAHYELVGVVNRMDREVFAPATCGELRLVYRLAYRQPKIQSRLPLTLNVVFYLPRPADGDCTAYLADWRAPSDVTVPGFARWLTQKGPLQPGRTKLSGLKSIETNYQVIRSSSGIRNMLGGNAEYVLRVFHLQSGRLVRGLMENTPDLERLQKDQDLRDRLLAFLKEPANFAKLDQGTLVIPDEFLADHVSSYSPHGIAREENRIFDRAFSEADFAELSYGANRNVHTPSAALRRLNDLSCIGCHQNRTIAGFHLLGEDREGTYALNAIFNGGSGHFRTELQRRMRYLADLAQSRAPSEDRPFSIAPSAGGPAHAGDFCGLPGTKSFPDWVCEPGLECQLLEGAEGEKELGKCAPKIPLSGDQCVKNFVTQNLHALDKMVQPWEVLGCGASKQAGYECRMPGEGFPSGMCTADCKQITDLGVEICGPIDGPGFGNCITDHAHTFDECLEKTHAEATRGRCNDQRACRNDYVCAKTDQADGACVPSYFLFQIRVDGHPAP